MAHGIIRVRNLSQSDISSTEIHNERQYQERDIQCPKNIILDNSPNNISKQGNYEGGKGYREEIETRFQEAGVTPRKNSVQAIEFMISASKDFFKNYSESAYLKDSLHWLEERYGKENVVTWSMHFDESTPHLHAIVVPIVEKEVKWKNRNGEGTRTENRLSARDITGGPKLLRQLQDDFFEHVSTEYKGYADWYRGTLVEEQLRHYTKETNHEIGQMRNRLIQLQHDAEALANLQKQIEEKQQEMEAKTAELQKRVEIRKDRNKGDGWKKGNEFFHKEPLIEKKQPLIDKEKPSQNNDKKNGFHI